MAAIPGLMPNPLYDNKKVFTAILVFNIIVISIGAFLIFLLNDNDWRIWVAFIGSIAGIIMFFVGKFVRMPPAGIIIFIIFLVGLGLGVGFNIWIFMDKGAEIIGSIVIPEDIDVENPGIVIPGEVTEGQNWLTGIWESLSSSFDSLFGNLGSLGQQ